MVDIFLKLVEQIIELIKLKHHNRQQFFKEIVEPLFIELQPVVDDYILLFRRARELASTGSTEDFNASLEEIRSAREKLLNRRIKVREMAFIVRSQYDDGRIKGFTDKVEQFFFSTGKPSEKISHGKKLVDLCDYVTEGNVTRENLLSFINHTLKNLENRWVMISQSYASLRIHCLNPTKSIK